jgi:hypothetical protein
MSDEMPGSAELSEEVVILSTALDAFVRSAWRIVDHLRAMEGERKHPISKYTQAVDDLTKALADTRAECESWKDRCLAAEERCNRKERGE